MLRELTLEITRACLNHCIHCSSLAEVSPSSQPIPFSLLRQTVEDALPLGLRSLSLSGGEPFLHPNIVELIESCGQYPLERLYVYTSGVMSGAGDVAVPISDARILECTRAADATLVFNVQSCIEAIHDAVVGRRGHLRLTLASMRNAARAGIAVECHIVPNRQNVSSLAATARELLRLGARKISFLRLVLQGHAAANSEALCLYGDLEAELRSQAAELMAEAGWRERYRFGVPFSGLCGGGGQCTAGVSKLIMRWDGTFFPCEAFKECGRRAFRLGSVHEDDVPIIYSRALRNSSLASLKGQIEGTEPCPAQHLYAAERGACGYSRQNVAQGI